MKTFTYKLNGLDSLVPKPIPSNEYPFNNWGCKPVHGILVESDKLVKAYVHWSAPILFETEAVDILDADSQFLKSSGINPSKRPDIGCSIHGTD